MDTATMMTAVLGGAADAAVQAAANLFTVAAIAAALLLSVVWMLAGLCRSAREL